MKKVIILFAITGICQVRVSEQRVVHHDYVTYYNATKKEPDSVVWNLTPTMVGCPSPRRKDAFAQDPAIPDSAIPADYKHSGFDKGHLYNYADAECDPTDAVECFFMSNMLPQIHPFNAGDWENVEKYERTLAAKGPIHIIAGGIGSIGHLPAGENIPEKMWKAIFHDGKWECWIMENKATSHGHTLDFWHVNDIADFDKQTGLPL